MAGILSSSPLALLSCEGPQICIDTPPTLPSPLQTAAPCHPLGLYLCIPVTPQGDGTKKETLQVDMQAQVYLGREFPGPMMPLRVWPRRRDVGPWKVHPLGLQILCPVGRGAAKERPELNSLIGGTQGKAPTTHSRFGTTNLPRGLLVSHVFFLPLKSFVRHPIKGVLWSHCPLMETQLLH